MNTATMIRPAVPATRGGPVGADELQAYVKGVMAARSLNVSDVQRLTGISRPTITAITKGRYSEGSERTRETLERLADGLAVPRAELFEAAGLSAEAPQFSTIPSEILAQVEAAQRALDEAARALRAAGEAQGRSMRPPPRPPKRQGGSRTPRKPPPEGGPQSSFRKGSRGTQ